MINGTDTILQGIVGSNAFGTVIEGQSDTDIMGVYMESKDQVLGLSNSKTRVWTTQPDNTPGRNSQLKAGGIDTTLFPLREFCRLAVAGNPNVLPLLYLPAYQIKDSRGERLIGMRTAFHSKYAGHRFLGYLISQRAKLEGKRSPCVARPDLVAKFGYDTKFAMQAIRIAIMGCEFMLEKHITLPMRQEDITFLKAIRTGNYTKEQIIGLIDVYQRMLTRHVDACTAEPAKAEINKFLVDVHLLQWR